MPFYWNNEMISLSKPILNMKKSITKACVTDMVEIVQVPSLRGLE